MIAINFITNDYSCSGCSEIQGKKAADTQDRVLTHFICLA